MPLSDHDEAIDAIGRPADLADLPAKWLTNGMFTLTFPSGEHRTFRIRTEPSGSLKGKRTIALLIGPDTSNDFEGFAFLENDGPKVWKRFKNHKQATHVAILWDLVRGEELDGYGFEVSKKCLACNRPLTTPQSIVDGYGPTCRERLGL